MRAAAKSIATAANANDVVPAATGLAGTAVPIADATNDAPRHCKTHWGCCPRHLACRCRTHCCRDHGRRRWRHTRPQPFLMTPSWKPYFQCDGPDELDETGSV